LISLASFELRTLLRLSVSLRLSRNFKLGTSPVLSIFSLPSLFFELNPKASEIGDWRSFLQATIRRYLSPSFRFLRESTDLRERYLFLPSRSPIAKPSRFFRPFFYKLDDALTLLMTLKIPYCLSMSFPPRCILQRTYPFPVR